jgi:SNF2 family DNA or RNA helicase
MEEKFAVAISKHRILGFYLTPYWISRTPGYDYFTAKERITTSNIKQFSSILNEVQKEIVLKIEEYNDNTLLRVFSKKKMSPQDFINSLTNELLNDHVRPYIEKRIAWVIATIQKHDTDLYLKHQLTNIYESDRILVTHNDAQTIFNFIKDGHGLKYFLSIRYDNEDIKLTKKEARIISNEPCSIIMQNKLFTFKDIDSKKLQPFFTKEFIEIPKTSEKKYFETFVFNSIRDFTVKATGFEIIDEKPQPIPILNIENDLRGNPSLLLQFKYDTKSIFSAKDTDQVQVSCSESDGHYSFKKIIRNPEFESDIILQLIRLGLLSTNTSYFNPQSLTFEDYNQNVYYILDWVTTHIDDLKDLNIRVENKLSATNYYIGHYDIKTALNDAKDWFDLKMVVEIAGHKIPFQKFKSNIQNKIREFELPDGKIFILPEEWFAQYADMFSFGKQDGDSIKLKKVHFPLLEGLISHQDSEVYEKILKTIAFDHKFELPEGVMAELRPYQLEGYSWMYALQSNNFNTCLADDMGLGKTLQTLTLLQKEINELKPIASVKVLPQAGEQLNLFIDYDEIVDSNNTEQIKPASLIIMPTSLIHNWKNEIEKFTPSLKVNTYIGSSRAGINEIIKQSDIILTTYGIARRDYELLQQYEFFYLILDESQMIKNPESKTYQAIIQLKSRHRMVLTGTPIENSLTDLWAQLNFLNPGLLGNYTFFKREYVTPVETNHDELIGEKLKKMIKPFILRRTKHEVAKDLPELTEQVVYCDMSEEQQKYYEEEKSKVRNAIMDTINQQGVERSSIYILQALMRLRQIANHPYLVDSNYLHNSGKFEDVCLNIDNIITEGHKVLIFSSFVKHLELFANYLASVNRPYCMLTGETKDRKEMVEKFQTDNEVLFFLISLKAGGVGLNLTAADYVFILDPWWNPAAENQAINRAHRIGQQNKVFVYRFITSNTIEEKIVGLQNRKAKLAETFVDENNPFKSLNTQEVLSFFE